MSVLVFSIGVLEALACVEHVRQSYLPLDLGRKRRRLVLDVGSGTIRHRETRRSSEFQRDPHVFLRSIQAAVEEEGDEKESEELAAIFQAVEARNIHSTQIMNHQDPVFLSVNDIDESDSCASSEISRTSTPNTVIMNMSPGLDRGSVVESPYIPSDSFSELLGPEIDEVFSNQKDIGITKVDIEKFICIREPDKQFESIDSNSPNIGEVLQSSNTQIVSKNSTVYTITNELLETKKTEINKGKSIDSTTDLLDTDIISIPFAESGIEKSTKDSLFTNSVLCDGHNTKIIMKNNELTCKSDKIGSNFDHPVIKDGEENTNNNIIINNTINFESQTATLKLPDNNKLSLLPNNTSVHNNDIVIQENDLEINHKINENSFNLSSIAETNNIETIEKCEILVESQAHSGKEPLIENKGKDEICETQLERVIESEKQSKNDEIQNAQTVLTNSINIVHHTNNYEYDRKKINGADQLNSFSEHENSAIVPKHENEPIQEVLLQAQLNESEMVSIKLDESKDKIIEEAIAGTIDNDESRRCIPDQSATISNSDKNIAKSTNNDLDVCKLQVAHNGQFDASGPIPTKPDVSNEFNKTIDHGMVKQDKDKETSSCIKVQTCNSLDSMNVCIDNNSNIAKETFSSDPGERKTIPTNGQANELIEVPHTLATIEHVLVSKGDSILDSSCPKDKVISTQQELLSEDIVPTDSKSIIVKNEDKYLTNDVFRENVVEERSESNKVEIKEANVNAHHKPESIREVSKSEKIFDEAKHSTNISIDTTNIKEEVYSEKADSVKSEIVEECVRHLVDVVSEQQTSDCKSDYNNHIDTHRQCDSEETVVTKEEFKPSVQTIPTGIALNEEHQVGSLKEVCAEIIVSKDTKSKGVDTDTIYSIHNNVSNESGNQEELIMSENAAANEDDATKKLRPVAPQTSRLKIETESKEEITSKDLLDVKESLKPLPQKEPAKDKGGNPSDRKAVKTDKGVLAKQETLNVSPFPDDVTLLVGDLPSQNQFTAVEDITSPDKAFWVRELKG
ncbi:unnamed protein product [Nezara viridula]|uniref:Uncharacterized protein n=1 Tax=Nezara viridula TaxID=85310 RepID=A0A9P0HGX8_NEZVI|nr:unnamed protein product [Nezara viridula]